MNNVQEEGVIRGVKNSVILPTILIFEILLLLPVRLLLRFRCVCKEWCDLIDSRVFKDTFLARRRRRPPCFQHRLFIVKGAPLKCWYGDYQSIVAFASASASASAVIPFPSSSSSSSCSSTNSNNSNDFEIAVKWSAIPMVNIMNHVDGIICLFDRGDYFYARYQQGIYFNWLAITLLNPALREFRKVLPPKEFDLLGDIYNRRIQGIGIGYNNNNEYKVVAIVTVFEKEEDYGSPYKHIGIMYHLSTNSWTILGDLSEEFDVSFKCFCHPESVFSSHGSLHWCVTNDDHVEESSAQETNKHEILAFDVTDESFRKIQFPHNANNSTSHRLFTVDRSTIALVESIDWNVFDTAIQIWVMNEYGNSDSWTKRWLITDLEDFASTLCFLDQDKILLESRRLELISYHLSKGQLGDEIPIQRDVFCFCPLVSCHDSFVSVKLL